MECASLCSFITYSQSNAASPIEKAADALLTPARMLFGGKSFTTVVTQGGIVRIEEKSNFEHLHPWMKHAAAEIAFKVALVAGLVLTPIGIALKAVSLACESTRSAYTNWNEPSPLQADMCREAYFEVCKNPVPFLAHTNGNGKPHNVFSPLALRECACDDYFHKDQTFDRLKSPRRANFEEKIVADICASYPEKSTIKIMSLGAGELFPEFRLLGLLLSLGYSIELSLVDKAIDFEKVQVLNAFYRRLNLPVILQAHAAVTECSGSIDVLCAFDFPDFDVWDEATADLFTANNLLKESGRSYLQYRTSDVVLDRNCTAVPFGNHGWIQTLAADIKQSIPVKESVSIAVLQGFLTFTFIQGAILGLADCKTINLTLVKDTDPYGYSYREGHDIALLENQLKNIHKDIRIQVVDWLPDAKFDLIGMRENVVLNRFTDKANTARQSLCEAGKLYIWNGGDVMHLATRAERSTLTLV